MTYIKEFDPEYNDIFAKQAEEEERDRMNGSWVIVTTNGDGQVDNLVGPFPSMEEATTFMNDNDAFFADLEMDLAENADMNHPGEIDTFVLLMNPPESVQLD